MCYDISIYYDPEVLERKFNAEIDREDFEEKSFPKYYHTSGFDHPDIPVITGQAPGKIQFYSWGLIPWWAKDAADATRLSNQTLNAKGETLFEKPAFRDSVKENRCMVLVNGFFEHHHHGGKTYPYFIRMKDREPFALAGIWSKWKKVEGLTRYSFSIITTQGNDLLTRIHNNPKLEGPRMPFILPRELEKTWIREGLDPQEIKDLIQPYPSESLDNYTVPRLRGKEYLGNKPEVIEPRNYDELQAEQGTLF